MPQTHTDCSQSMIVDSMIRNFHPGLGSTDIDALTASGLLVSRRLIAAISSPTGKAAYQLPIRRQSAGVPTLASRCRRRWTSGAAVTSAMSSASCDSVAERPSRRYLFAT